MNRLSLISLILILIFFTTYIKKSSKDLDQKIYQTREEISLLSERSEILNLEFDYLSSPERLIELKNLYFEDIFISMDIQSIGVIKSINNQLTVEELEIYNNDWR